MLLSDLRHAARRLLATPGFTLVAVASLGLGIGANSAVFSVVGRVLFFDPGVGEPETLVDIHQVYRGLPYWALSYEHYQGMKELDVFSGVTAYFEFNARMESPAGDGVAYGELVAGDFFGTLGVPLAVGRNFTREEQEVEGAHPVAILDHAFWTRVYGADPGVLGSTVRLNARPHTIVGVAAPGFEGKALPLVGGDLYVPYAQRQGLRQNDPTSTNLVASARLAPGVGVVQARAALDAYAAALQATGEESDGFGGFRAWTSGEVKLHPGLDGRMAPLSALLFTVVGLVLLIACTNLASFLLARAADRRREFAVRIALGASRARMVGQLLLESVMLGLLGGVAGVLVGMVSVRLLLRVRPPMDIPFDVQVPLDWRIVLFTAAVSMVAALLFGLAPALQGARGDVAGTLRDEAGGVIGGRARWSLRGALVTAQVAVSLVLLAAAGLFVRSMTAAARVDPGFDPGPVAVVQIAPRMSGYDDERAVALYEELGRRAAALPGVRAAALGDRLPMEMGNSNTWVRTPGTDLRDAPAFEVASVTPGYLETMDIELLGGRDFTAADRAGAPSVVILNRQAAARLWPDDPDPVSAALGRTVLVGSSDEQSTVVGVAATTKIKTLSEGPRPYFWRPVAQSPWGEAWLMARGSEPAPRLAARLRAVAQEVDPDLFGRNDGSAARTVALQLYLPRMGASILAVLGGIALVLTSIGLYGVVGYAVARRQKEVGIRMSLGAARGNVVRLMMSAGVRLVVVGGVVGLLLAVAASRLLSRFLFGISPLDPVTFVAVPFVLVSVAALASWLPARRAARVDPMRTLRAE